MDVRQATVTRSGQVTIPDDMRRALGVPEGGAVEMTCTEGVVTLRSVNAVPSKPSKNTLTALLAGFDPERHRHIADERDWDDEPVGRESL